MRFGAGSSGPMRMLGQYMMGSAATFGLDITSPKMSVWIFMVYLGFSCRLEASSGTKESHL